MKRNLKQVILFLVGIFLSSILFSQPSLKDSVAAYDYWAKRGIIEMVHAAMQDYFATVDSSKLIKEKNGAKAYHEKFILNIDKKEKEVIENDFQTIITFLQKNNWTATATKVCQPLIDNYNQRKPFDDNFFIITTSNNNNKILNEKKIFILNSYSNNLKQFKIKAEKQKTNGLLLKPDEEAKPNPEKDDLIYNLLYLLGGFVLGLIVHFLYSNWRYNTTILARDQKYNSNFQKNQKNFNLQIGHLETKISELIAKNKSLMEENLKLGEIIEKNKEITFETKSEGLIHTQKTIEEILPTSTFYFTIPESDGSFRVTNGKNYQERDCFYKIEVDKSNQKGKLFFISGDFDSRAFDNIDYYLNPVCEIENISDRTFAKRINVITYGSVLLSGESWKIDPKNKIKIKLI